MKAQRIISQPWALLAVGLLMVGCTKSDTSCPVSGKISVNGRPAANLYVVFHTTDGKPPQSPSSARTREDGSFTLRVPKPGEYTVTVFRPQLIEEQGGKVEGEDAFRGHYRDPQRPASKATISKGENALLSIDLTFDFAKP